MRFPWQKRMDPRDFSMFLPAPPRQRDTQWVSMVTGAIAVVVLIVIAAYATGGFN